jgi:hypothetical protein
LQIILDDWNYGQHGCECDHVSDAPYKMAGIDNFQQSGLNISLPKVRNRDSTVRGLHNEGVPGMLKDASAWEVGWSRRVNAMMREMKPLSNSLSRTAVAAEYILDGGVDTRE